MRLQAILLLSAAAVLVSVDASATTDLKTTQAQSLAVDGNVAAPKRVLRVYTTAAADDKEERMSLSWLKKFFNIDTTSKLSTKVATSKVAQKVAVADDKVDDVLKGMNLETAFTHLGLDKITKVDDFFTSPKFNKWVGHMVDTNRDLSRKDAMTVTKFLVSQRGDENVAKLVSKARASKNPAVRNHGINLQREQFTLWIKAGKTPEQVRKEVPSLSKRMMAAYEKTRDEALVKAQEALKKAEEKVKANTAADVLRG